MTDIDPTPDTPVTIGDRMAWWRGDMVARILALQGSRNESLTTVTDALFTQTNPRMPYLLQLDLRLENIESKLSALQGSRNESLTTVTDALFTQTNPRMPYLLHLQLDVEDRLDKIQAALGAEPYGSVEVGSLRGYLAALLTVTSQMTNGLPPSLLDINTDRQSVGIELYNGRKYAIWPNPFDGYTVTNEGRDVSLGANSWIGHSAYIQTTDPQPWVNGTPDAPNMWLNLTGTGSYNFSVGSAYPIKVFLRKPLLSSRRIDSTLIGTNANGTWHGIRWSPDPEVSQSAAGGLVVYSLDNTSMAYTNYKCALSRGVYRADNQADNATYVSGTITVGNVNSMYLIWNSPFYIDFSSQ